MAETPDRMRRRVHDTLFVLDLLNDEEQLPVPAWNIFPTGPVYAMGLLDAPYEELPGLVGRWARFLRTPVERTRTPLWPGVRIACGAVHRGVRLEVCARIPDPPEELEPTQLEDVVGNWARRRPRLSPGSGPDEVAYVTGMAGARMESL